MRGFFLRRIRNPGDRKNLYADVNGQQSAPIYTVTEERQRHGQQAD